VQTPGTIRPASGSNPEGVEQRSHQGRHSPCTPVPQLLKCNRQSLTAPHSDGNHFQMTAIAKSLGHPGRPRREAGDTDAACEDFERLCRERGIRVTPQRMAVYRLLAQDTTHPTAEYVYGRLRRRLASLSFTTVYRVLECLEQEGFVRRVGVFDGTARYEANLTRHHHCVCRVCGRIADFEGGSSQELGLPWPAPAGFVPDELEIRILGTCSRCHRARRSGRPADTKRSPI